MLRLLALCAWTGLTAGLELAVLEALWNDYPSLGFWRNAVVMARPLVACGAAAGLGAGLLLVLLLKVGGLLVGTDSLAAPRPALVVIGLGGASLALILISGWLFVAGVSPAFILPAAGGVAAALLLTAVALAGLAAAGSHRGLALLLAGPALLGLKYVALRFVYLRFIQTGEETGIMETSVLALGTILVAGLASFVVSSRPGARTPEAILAAAVAIPVSLWLAAALPPRRQDAPDGRLNVLLIGIDTLRIDRTLTGEDAPPRPVTPRIASYARDGVVFTRAISQAPWTMPAFASIMTGLYPFEHGADSLLGSLPRIRVTLAEVLCEAGYATGAVVSHNYVTRKVGLAQGFEVVDESNVKGHRGESSTGVTESALAFIDSRRDRPFFLFAHYFDPHYEYEDRDTIDAAAGYHGWLEGMRDIMALRLMRHMFSPEDVEHLRDLYDEEVAHTDARIGRLLDGLKQRGLYDRTAIVIVADHGEELMERGWLGHTITLHDEVVRVPLIVILPGAGSPGRFHDGTVETRSIFATVLDTLGIEREAGGRSLPAASAGETPAPPGAFSAVWMPDAHVQSGSRVRMASYQTDGWKLILDVDRGHELLHDLRSDPLESVDRAASEPEVLATMRSALRDWLEEMLAIDGSGGTRTPTEEELEMLRSLGYL